MPSLNTSDTYPVMDAVTLEVKQALGATGGFRMGHVKAQWTGVYGAPKKGDWYLSGAIIEAYQAKGDMSEEFPIAKLVVR